MTDDEEHLKLLSVFHYVVGALGALIACFPLIHVAVGILMVAHPASMNAGRPALLPFAVMGYGFILIGGLLVLAGWAGAICTMASGYYLARRKKRTFSVVMAAVLCMFVPFGTVLGVFTILVLSRESVKQRYAGRAAAAA